MAENTPGAPPPKKKLAPGAITARSYVRTGEGITPVPKAKPDRANKDSVSAKGGQGFQAFGSIGGKPVNNSVNPFTEMKNFGSKSNDPQVRKWAKDKRITQIAATEWERRMYGSNANSKRVPSTQPSGGVATPSINAAPHDAGAVNNAHSKENKASGSLSRAGDKSKLAGRTAKQVVHGNWTGAAPARAPKNLAEATRRGQSDEYIKARMRPKGNLIEAVKTKVSLFSKPAPAAKTARTGPLKSAFAALNAAGNKKIGQSR